MSAVIVSGSQASVITTVILLVIAIGALIVWIKS